MFGGPLDYFMFNAVPIIILIIGVIIFIGIISAFGKNISEYTKNNSKPQKTEAARIIAKRVHTWGGTGNMSAHTSYYVTFEFENAVRLEVPVSGHFYGMHVDGDTGILTYQGTRFINFEREAV